MKISLPRPKIKPTWMAAFIVCILLIFAEFFVFFEFIPSVILARPSEILKMLWHLIYRGQVWPHLWRTCWEVLVSIGLAGIVGIPVGFTLWRLPTFGKSLEPYLIGTYAMPLVLFYPFLLVIFGLGPIPIIIIASLMGVIPVILNSWIAFSEIPEIYIKVSRSYHCYRLARLRRVLLPAATPLIFAGLKLSTIYSFVGVIVMEFMVGDVGLGFKVSYDYGGFKITEMYAYVAIIILLAAIMTALLLRGEGAIRQEERYD